ncbi:hypothetical protein J3454_09840 [Erythrobacter sp. NFXS35]|uniref:hypothetical protein n=1 Tax=Erythrobacter sp. NFXS35 TaxID=2818436 RepID=UPI0032DE8B8D
MIDPEWVAHAAMLAETPLAGGEAGGLAQELGDERELLPWLLVTRGGFADWPETRAALAEAGKAVIRPRALLQAARSGAAQEQREACREALMRAITKSDQGECSAVDDMIRVRQHVSRRPQPNDFISAS